LRRMIEVDQVDLIGRKDGWGAFHRIYKGLPTALQLIGSRFQRRRSGPAFLIRDMLYTFRESTRCFWNAEIGREEIMNLEEDLSCVNG
jgi:hypothetical protein